MQIELANGITFEGSVSKYIQTIWIRMTTAVVTEQLLNLIVPENTDTITEHWPAQDIIYHHYTHFGEVKLQEDGTALFYLTGGEDAYVEKKWTVPEQYLPEGLRGGNIQNGREQDLGSGADHAEPAEDSESSGQHDEE